MIWCFLAACSNPDEPEPPTPVDTGVADTGTPTEATGCPEGLVGPTAETTTGCLQGRSEQGVDAFLGVPYAEPPVGDLRWARPVPKAPWPDPLPALEPGPSCIQSNGTLDLELLAGQGQEDCLTLNVVRPEGTRAGDDLPVLFFIHGGGHSDGSGSSGLMLGDSLARPVADPPASPDVTELGKHAVVITINYRLAQLGWLSLPALSDEDPDGVSGNQGLWDALVALRWAHDNARALGGDPDRLTLFGESAGSLSTCALLASPEAAGLMSSVILESGVCTSLVRSFDEGLPGIESGYEQGQRLVQAVGCDGGTAADELACMRALPASDLMAEMVARVGILGDGESYGLAIDGVLIPDRPQTLFSTGAFNRVPVVMGVNEDEGTLFTALAPMTSPETLALTLRGAALLLGGDGQELVDLYDPALYGDDVMAAWSAFVTDSAFICPARKTNDLLAPHTEVRAYFFRRDSWLLQSLGASHGFELPFVFGTGFFLGDDQQLSDRMVSAWTSVADGSPEVDPIGPWPLFGTSEDAGGTWVQLDQTISILHGVRDTQCSWFEDQTFVP